MLVEIKIRGRVTIEDGYDGCDPTFFLEGHYCVDNLLQKFIEQTNDGCGCVFADVNIIDPPNDSIHEDQYPLLHEFENGD